MAYKVLEVEGFCCDNDTFVKYRKRYFAVSSNIKDKKANFCHTFVSLNKLENFATTFGTWRLVVFVETLIKLPWKDQSANEWMRNRKNSQDLVFFAMPAIR